MTAPVPAGAGAKPALETARETQAVPRVLGDTVQLSGIGKKIKAGAKPVAAKTKSAQPKTLPAKAKPAPVMLPPVAIVEETRAEEPVPPGLLTADDEPLESTAPRYVEAKQEEMQFEPARGRFEKTHETIYRGENLDQPTFRRRRLAIRL